jgi:hypothetical protein
MNCQSRCNASILKIRLFSWPLCIALACLLSLQSTRPTTGRIVPLTEFPPSVTWASSAPLLARTSLPNKPGKSRINPIDDPFACPNVPRNFADTGTKPGVWD